MSRSRVPGGQRVRRRALLARPLLLALALLGALATPSAAHVVSQGVGSQGEIEVSPRRVRVKFNLGFSALLGLGELKRMDSDADGVIRPAEQDAYLERLAEQIQGALRVHLDGQALSFRVVSRRGLGILGPIEQVGFDTYYELEAPCQLGPGSHELTYFDGTYPDEVSQQLIWFPLREGLSRQETSQSQPPLPPVELQGVRKHYGRDLKLRFAFKEEALADDACLALLEPSLDGLEASAQALEDGLAGGVAGELNAMAFAGVRFGARAGSSGFTQGAPMALDRVLKESGQGAQAVPREDASPTPGAQPAAQRPETEGQRMIASLLGPFSLGALLLFMVWGAGHALMPGHGKTMVAAYLLGTEGRLSDAFKLGAIVTLTHTVALYTVGLGIVYFVTESQWSQVLSMTAKRLTLLSGLGLVAYGLWIGAERWSLFRARHARSGGEEPSSPAEPGAHDHEGHDHDSHDHEAHDHAAHDHAAHDHEGHDHDSHDPGHDHAAHDHAAHDHAAHDHDHAAHDHEGHDHDSHDPGHDHAAHDHAAHDHAAHDHDHAAHDHGHAAHDHAAHDHAAHDHAAHDHAAHDHAAHDHEAHDHAAHGHAAHGHGHAAHDHGHAAHEHGHDHAHMSEEEHALAHARDAASVTSFRDLLVLGVTGGLVPCPAGVTLVIYSLSFKGNNTLKCFAYLSAFSLGLAGVLVAIASTMVLTQRFLVPSGEGGARARKVIDALPLVSCAAIIAVGFWLMAQAYFPQLAAAQQEVIGTF